MTLTIETEPVPLVLDADGVARVAATRVTLETLVAAFEDGATAEEIVHQYPSLQLAEVYSVIGYYLRRREDIAAYLRDRQNQAAAVRSENESRFDRRGVRARLMARRVG
ncbi:MAG: DUF433 domain-containing protein [Candidatus Rokubacteria bacterium]|nr:DUF433 domain-containing protein [Candidatus Rokubacteria bacterium]